MNQQPLVYHFSTETPPALFEVGGKGLSLIRMSQVGFPVPPGFVLTAVFFQPWFEQLHQSGLWTTVLHSPPEKRKAACDAAKAAVLSYEFTDEQCDVLSEAAQTLTQTGAALFAVRSSSPEEDLEGASFAGGYETSLGVTPDKLPEAIRHSFVSVLDERIFVYKQERGFDVAEPHIAVVVQTQIASDSAGVAFSLNPLNNCYDEVVINANAGLGESVVSGAVTPDTFVVDRVQQTILSKEIGRKETAVFLQPDGGTTEQTGIDTDQPCLTDQQALKIAALTGAVEAAYGKPIDIEWAYADRQLFLLQARPITAYYPVPDIMLTKPGEPKILYGDKTLLKQGINEPLTVMGTDFLALSDEAMSEFTGGVGASDDIITGLGHTFDGRMYLNVSNNMKLQGYKRIVREYRTMDVGSSEILANINQDEYIPDKLPPNLKGMLWKALWRNLTPLMKSWKAFRQPDAYKADVAADVAAMRLEVEAEIDQMQSFVATTQTILQRYLGYMDEAMASLLVSELARMRLKRLLNKESESIQQKVVYLERALPENVTIEMGMAMYRLAQFPEIMACASGIEFVQHLQAGDFSPEFMEAWHDFMDNYGFRCPLELDLGTPRYSEQPAQFYNQLRTMAENGDPDNNPEAIFARSTAERETIFNELHDLLAQKSKRKAKTFRTQYNHLVAFGGLRESHKYYYIWVLNQLRKKVLLAAEDLVKNGRLDNTQQVFDLTFEQLDQALADPTLDLRAQAYENTAYLRRFAHVRDFPRIFDSRGKILRPARREARNGELMGQPISPGVVQGPVKVLHSPDEKPVLPGDILVARATDPGWTPLFTNAAAIILEVGGILQHGSLVAREYGKPCVAGIDNITHLLRDGQLVEVDGLQGTIRLITGAPSSLPDGEVAPISEWPIPHSKGQYLRGSAAELLPDPMCPLFETMGIEALDLGTRQLFGYIAGQPLEEVNSVIYTINGYAYLSAKFSGKQWFLMTTRGLVYIFKLVKNGERHWRDLHLKYVAALDQWQAQPVTDMSAADLLTGTRELTRFGMETYNSLQAGIIPASTTSETVFTKLYEKFIQCEGDPPALTFILGFNSMPIRAEKSLFDLASWAAAQDGLVTYLHQTPAAQLTADLAETQPPAGLSAEIWLAWQTQFYNHLAQYGHTIYDLDFLKPTPANDPTPLLETLKVYLNGQGSNPHERQAALAEKREGAMAAVRARYRRGVRRWLFEKTLNWAQTAVPLREEGLADLGLGWPRLRQMLLEIGRRGVAAGFLDRPDDIFWLREDEVETAVTALDHNEKLDSMTKPIAERKAIWRARNRVIPPSILPPKSKYLGIDVEKWMPAHVDQAEEHQISGVGASPGRITGTARVLHGPDDFAQMQPGDILVAAITTPAWTPLFALATAVVTDIGGPLSHSSIVAREYGIPAVLGTGVATKRIHSGQTITVDGAEGAVLLSAA
jgi:phosphoenolpyruvate synthase/pyruvate phosphate dikinase